MDVLRRHRDASHQAIVTRIHNLAVVRKAPVIMACRLSNDGPMTAGALRVLGVCECTHSKMPLTVYARQTGC